MIINNDVLLLSATNEETPYEHLLHYPKRKWYVHYWSFWSRAWDWYRVLSNCTVVLFSDAIAFSYWLLQGCAGSWIQIRPQIASNGKLQLSPWNQEVNGNCNLWHAWFDCCCVAKSNRGTVYASKNIPNRNHPPPSPPPKKCKKCTINDVFTN